jgi:hypothetical protein
VPSFIRVSNSPVFAFAFRELQADQVEAFPPLDLDLETRTMNNKKGTKIISIIAH